MSENVEIVASFPFPPKQFYENLTEDEILNMKPPPLPSKEIETLLLFGNEQSLKIKEKENLILNDEIIKELKDVKDEIFDNFKVILKEIEIVQDSSKVNDMIKSIDEPFQKVFNITSKLTTIQSAISFKNCIEKDFEEINKFLSE